MTRYRQSDVLLVPFPFTDQSAVKLRPAVVLTSDDYNQRHVDLILAPITGARSTSQDEVSLNDWQTEGLFKPSSVKPLLSTFDAVLVRRKLGSLSTSDFARVQQMFARVLGLS
jgi:mRNA interferase MazF